MKFVASLLRLLSWFGRHGANSMMVMLAVGAAVPLGAPILVGVFDVPGVTLSPMSLGLDLLVIVVIAGAAARLTKNRCVPFF